MRHHTTDPAKRAEHIANRLEQKHEDELAEQGLYPYEDWPRFWLKTYREILPELAVQ
jgi:hypothetical protein